MNYWSLTKQAAQPAVPPQTAPTPQPQPVAQPTVTPTAKPVAPAPAVPAQPPVAATPAMPSDAELQQFIQQNSKTVTNGSNSYVEPAPTQQGAAQYKQWTSTIGKPIIQKLRQLMPPGMALERFVSELKSLPEAVPQDQIGVEVPDVDEGRGGARQQKPADLWVEPMLREIAKQFANTPEAKQQIQAEGAPYASALFNYFDAYASTGHVKKWYAWLASQANKITQNPATQQQLGPDAANFSGLTGSPEQAWQNVRKDLYTSYKQQETQPTDSEPNTVKAMRQAVQMNPQGFAQEVLQHMFALRKGEQQGSKGNSTDQTSSDGKSMADRSKNTDIRNLQDINDDEENPNIPNFSVPSSARKVGPEEQKQLAQLYQEFQQMPNAQAISQRLDQSNSSDGVPFSQYVRDFPIAAQKAPLFALYGFDKSTGQALWEQMMPMIGVKLRPEQMNDPNYVAQNIAILKEHLADEDPEITAPLYQHFYDKGQEWFQQCYDHQKTSAMAKTGNFQPDPTQLKAMGRLSKVAGALAFREWRQLKAKEQKEGKNSWAPNSSNAVRRWALISSKFPGVTKRLTEARQVVDDARQSGGSIRQGGYIPLFDNSAAENGKQTGRFISVNKNNEYQITKWELDEGGNRKRLLKSMPVDDHNVQMLSYTTDVQDFIPQALDKIEQVDPTGLRKKISQELMEPEKFPNAAAATELSGTYQEYMEKSATMQPGQDRLADYRVKRAAKINSMISSLGITPEEIMAVAPKVKGGVEIKKNPNWIKGMLTNGLDEATQKPLRYGSADFKALATMISAVAQSKGQQQPVSGEDLHSDYVYEYDKYNNDDLTLINNAMPMMASAYARDLVEYKKDMTFRGFGKGTFDKDAMFYFIKIGGLHANWLGGVDTENAKWPNPDVKHGKPLQEMFPDRNLHRQQFNPEDDIKRQKAIDTGDLLREKVKGLAPIPISNKDDIKRHRRLVPDSAAPGGFREEHFEPDPSKMLNNIYRSYMLEHGEEPGKLNEKGKQNFLSKLRPMKEQEVNENIQKTQQDIADRIDEPLATNDPQTIADFAHEFFENNDASLSDAIKKMKPDDPQSVQKVHTLKEQLWHKKWTDTNKQRQATGQPALSKDDFAKHYLEEQKGNMQKDISSQHGLLRKIKNSKPENISEMLDLYTPLRYKRFANPPKPGEDRDDPNRPKGTAIHPTQTPYEEQGARYTKDSGEPGGDFIPVKDPRHRSKLRRHRQPKQAAIMDAFYKYVDSLDRLGNIRERLSRFAMSTENVDLMISNAENIAMKQIELAISGE